MADNTSSAAPSNPEGSNGPRGQKRARSPESYDRNVRGRWRGRGRGEGGRGRGRGGQSRGRGGGRGGREDGHGSNKTGGRYKKGDMGRQEYSRNNLDRRQRNDNEQENKRHNPTEGENYASTQFSKEEIDAEGRKPKKKVAVLIGYAGSGYKGMQINTSEKTIEGDIFKAFVAAGAISKANADDPKKSSLVRCARTDKGVHAAGNVISLKLIVEDPKIVEKINENLPPQIRIWGMERTNNAFSCYQTCDSRWYEYLIPTYSFVPPHPDSYMGKKLLEYAEKEGVLEEFNARQADVADFWASADEEYIKPILDELDLELRKEVMAEIHATEELPEGSKKKAKSAKAKEKSDTVKEEDKEIKTEEKTETARQEGNATTTEPEKDPGAMEVDAKAKEEPSSEESSPADTNSANPQENQEEPKESQTTDPTTTATTDAKPPSKSVLTPLESAIKRIKAAYIVAKKAYRISPTRKERVQKALNTYIGTHNFHNYTIQKMYSDPSSKRVIRSFTVGSSPIYINDTEWLSLKVHGQSFMMHQIRKMVAMATLMVRCGSDFKRVMEDSFGHVPISIPKAPGLGLLLERPVFDTYNEQAVSKFQREKIDFGKFEGEMLEFKQREIYDRIFREEERDHQFHAFFHHIDHFRTDFFLWVTAGGLDACRQSKARNEFAEVEMEVDGDGSDNEPDANGQEG